MSNDSNELCLCGGLPVAIANLPDLWLLCFKILRDFCRSRTMLLCGIVKSFGEIRESMSGVSKPVPLLIRSSISLRKSAMEFFFLSVDFSTSCAYTIAGSNSADFDDLPVWLVLPVRRERLATDFCRLEPFVETDSVPSGIASRLLCSEIWLISSPKTVPLLKVEPSVVLLSFTVEVAVSFCIDCSLNASKKSSSGFASASSTSGPSEA
mmetsp:Transcript_4936/g.11752  ORF Transcript_4936/g.11752 Transcript_4936/m.11752 type:complete len:209 (-) Transcript_4936:5653-6279(-)